MRQGLVQTLLLSAVITVASSAAAGDAVMQDVDRSKVCMTQDQVQARPGIPQTYQGKTYYLCCPMCVSTFAGDPERYAKTHDPVNGQVVDKATAPVVGYRGRAYFFESEASRAAFAADPERYVASQHQ